MHPSDELRKLLQLETASPSLVGTVSSTGGAFIRFVDKGQTRTAYRLPGDTSVYSPGDLVRVEGSALLGKVSARKTKYVYV